MKRAFSSCAAGWSSALRLAAGAALFAGAGLICAQTHGDSGAGSQSAGAAVPAAPRFSDSSSAIPSSGSAIGKTASMVPSATANVIANSRYGTGFGLPQTQFPAPATSNFQSYRGFEGGGTAFMGAGRPASGYYRFSRASQGGIPGTAGLGFQGSGSFGSGAPPNFNQMMRANIALPFASSVGSFKLTYRDMLNPGASGTGGNFGQGTTGVLFTTTNLGNGVFFSAGTNVGKGSMAGTPPGGFGSNSGATGPKPSRPAVTLKLSF
jgi:hypothetical protein